MPLQAHPCHPVGIRRILVDGGQRSSCPPPCSPPVLTAAGDLEISPSLREGTFSLFCGASSSIRSSGSGFFGGGGGSGGGGYPVGRHEGETGEVEVRGEGQALEAGEGGGRGSDDDDAAVCGNLGLRREAPRQEEQRRRLLRVHIRFLCIDVLH